MNTRLIHKWMKKNNHTQRSLAAKFGVAESTIWRRILGHVKPDYAFLVVLSKMMKVSIEELQKDRK